MLKRLALVSSAAILTVSFCEANALAQVASTAEFTCGTTAPSTGHALSSATVFHPAVNSAFGFDLATAPGEFSGGACSGDKPFFFSASVPEGNYRVTVVLGGPQSSVTTVRAESRRLMVLEQSVPTRGSSTWTFNVNVRVPEISTPPPDASHHVKLKPREIGALDWDTKLTLEFNGEHPSVRSIAIASATDVPTLYLAGDSTVVDQDKEPWAAWGQMLPLFFGEKLSIANEAESGETIRSFVGEGRLEKILSTIKPGDFLMIQFAHNDQKQGSGYVPAATDYQTYLRRYIAEAKAHGATPILVTSMNRRAFDSSGHILPTLGDYPASMREVAASEHVALIDLNAMSKTLFETMGEQGTLKAFVHYPANSFPGQPQELKDDTHFNSYGAYELARCIVKSVGEEHLPLAPYLRKDIPTFDPAKPDALANWHLPASPFVEIETPYGR